MRKDGKEDKDAIRKCEEAMEKGRKRNSRRHTHVQGSEKCNAELRRAPVTL
jgi:hypothetical protein